MVTPKLNPHFLEFSKCLGAHDERYLLIGGYAVGAHGWPSPGTKKARHVS